jgi:hypothetical protein
MEVNRRLLTTMKGLMELTSNQRTILDLVSEGLSFSDVARKLSVTKQHIQQTYRLATSLVLSGLIDVARVNQVEVRKVDPSRGVLWGYSPWLGSQVFVTFTPKRGVRVWNWIERPDEVRDRALLEDAKNYLLELADRNGLALTSQEKMLHAAKLAQLVFSRLVPEAKE